MANKRLSTGKVWCFAVGQFGWSILAALISSWLVNYYQPDLATRRPDSRYLCHRAGLCWAC